MVATTTANDDKYAGITTTSVSATTAAASRAAAKSRTSLGQDQFLKLMTTQMTHQDPNEPMKNGEFLSQMAQFGTVSGIQDLQASFANFAASINSDQALQATGLIGRYVSVQSTQGVLPAGGEISGKANLTSSTTSLKIAISKANTGELVQTVDLGNQSAGAIPFVWDGTNSAGTLASPGVYKIQATAQMNGKSTAVPTDINSRVESVNMANGSSGLKVNLAGDNSVDFAQIKQVL
ncbi:MAG TPA: flagellar hook capping protein [Methylococcaceae bacterium]|nr:flagellar hook capping protein [Methylococcaceae bacterium]